MEMRWGLDLDMSAVRLMRRNGEAWVEHGRENIDSPDIESRLARLIEPIENGEAVTLFLPRDQILFTRVQLDASTDPTRQIEAAMEGRTPYSLDELSIDWEAGDDDSVWVAAIARDTLDEAAAFAEVRHLKIAGYSTLFSDDDFPRAPKFDGPDLVAEESEPPAPQFATARVPSRPPDASVAAASAAASAKARFTPQPVARIEPVVLQPSAKIGAEPAAKAEPSPTRPVIEVEDATPVVQVKAPSVPLDPGLPISAPNAPPRIRSDIGAASVSGHVASLTPPGGSVRMRRNRAPVSTLAVFAIAFLMTVGVAVLVWNFLPMRPGGSTVKAPVDTGALPRAVVKETSDAEPETDIALAGTETVESEPEIAKVTPEPEPEVALPEPEIAEPEVLAETAPLVAEEAAPILDIALSEPGLPLAGDDIVLASFGSTAFDKGPGLPLIAAPSATTLPELDKSTPAFKLPKMEANIHFAPPYQGPDPDIDESSDSIFVSAFELPDPATDAIALPAVSGLTSDELPNVTGRDLVALTPPGDPVADAVNQALADALAGPGGLIQTAHARSLPDTAPRARPEQFTDDIERQQFGGLTRVELEDRRPPARPASAQSIAAEESQLSEPSKLAVAQSLAPRTRPEDIAALVRAARVQQEAARVTASATIRSPDTSHAIEAALQDDGGPASRPEQPRGLTIPTNASVARQATFENAIRLNRINLVGVYGAPSDRRALVRLSSGRYVKVKVGDRVDGGTVAQITDSELYYRKGNRTLSLQVPQG